MYVSLEPRSKSARGLTGIVKNKVNPSTPDARDVFRKRPQIIPKDVLLRSSESLTTSRLKLLDVLLSHVDQKRQIGRVTPETNLGELVEEELLLLLLLFLAQVGVRGLRLRKPERELEYGLVRAGKGVALLTEEDI